MKFKSIVVIFFLISSFIPFVPSVSAIEEYDWFIDGDTVYVDTPSFYLSATPHTLSSSGWVEFEVLLKTTTEDLDFAWGFDSTNGLPKRPQLWRSYEHSETDWRYVEKWQSTTVYEVVSYTNLGIDDYDNHTVTFGNRNNTYLFEVIFNAENGQYTQVYAFSSFEQNGDVYTLTGNNNILEKYTKVSTYQDWWDLPAELFTKVNYEFGGMDTWYLARDVTINEDVMYKIRTWVEVPFGGLEGTEGKYFWAVKPNSLTIQQAISSNLFYYIDPWFDSAWLYRKPFYTNSSMVVSDVTSEHPFLLHIESDDDLANKTHFGGRDIVITDNDSNILPFEIEYFNQVTGEFIAWVNASYSSSKDTRFYIYYGNPDSQRLENIDNTWTDNHVGIWHLSEQANEWEYDATFSAEPTIINLTDSLYNYLLVYSQGSGGIGIGKTFELVKGTFTGIDEKTSDANATEDMTVININGTYYYAVAYSGYGDDGMIRTFEVLPDGTVGATHVDEWEFDTTYAKDPELFYIANNTFGVAYTDTSTDGIVKTFNVSNTGDIFPMIDSWEFDTANAETIDVIRLNDTNMFAFVYAGYQDDGYIKTIEIADDGTITKSAYDTYEYDTVQGYNPDTIHVASDIYAIAYTGAGNDGWLITIDIWENGNIGTTIDSFEFDTETANHPSIAYSYNNIYAIAYGESPEGYIITVQILQDGEIIDFVIDEYVFNANKAEETILLRVPYQAYPPIQFITGYRGQSDSGFFTTFGVTEDGYIYVLFRDSSGHNNWGVAGEGNMDYMPIGVEGAVYLGQDFDGVDDYIDVDDDSSLYTGQKGTVDLWFKLDNQHDSTDTAKRLIGRNTHLGTNGEFLMELHSDGTLRARLYDGSFHTAQTTKNSWDADVWYYVAFKWDTTPTGFGMNLFWNLINDGNNTDINYFPNDAGDVHIGLYIDADKDPFEGVIDEVRLHGHIIDEDFMQTNYNMITYQGTGDGTFISLLGEEEYWFEFLEPPLDFHASTYNTTRIDLTWDNEPRADYTYIRYDPTTYPTTRSEGNFSCNITGDFFSQEGLLNDTTYYFSAWGYNSTNNTFSQNYTFTFNTTLETTVPPAPTNLVATALDQTRIQLSWDLPFNADYTYFRYSNVTYPTSRTEGSEGCYVTTTICIQENLVMNTTYYFSAWGYNSTTDEYSVTYATVNESTLYGIIPCVGNWYPYDNSSFVCLPVNLGISVCDADGQTMNIRFYSNYSGSWQIIGQNFSLIPNGTYYMYIPEFVHYNTTYYWRVLVSDEGGLTNYTAYNEIYSFTTAGQPCGACNKMIADDDTFFIYFSILGIFGLFSLMLFKRKNNNKK